MSVHLVKLSCANYIYSFIITFLVFYQLSKNDFISTRLTLDMTSTSLPKCWRRYAYLSSTYGFRLGIPSFSNLSSMTARRYSKVTRRVYCDKSLRAHRTWKKLRIVSCPCPQSDNYCKKICATFCQWQLFFNIVLKVSSSKSFLTCTTAVIFRQVNTPYFQCEVAVFDSEKSGTLRLKGQSGLTPVFATSLLPLQHQTPPPQPQ